MGFGFVCFDAPDAASAAIAEMNGFRLENKPLYVALAQPKAIRRQQLAQHYGRMGMPHQGMGMMGYAYYPPGMAPRFNARNPGFRGRPMPPGFTGGRGVPFIRGSKSICTKHDAWWSNAWSSWYVTTTRSS